MGTLGCNFRLKIMLGIKIDSPLLFLFQSHKISNLSIQSIIGNSKIKRLYFRLIFSQFSINLKCLNPEVSQIKMLQVLEVRNKIIYLKFKKYNSKFIR